MLLKAFTLLVVASLGVTLFIRSPQAKRVGWIVTGSLVLLGLLAVQLLRTLDSASSGPVTAAARRCPILTRKIERARRNPIRSERPASRHRAHRLNGLRP